MTITCYVGATSDIILNATELQTHTQWAADLYRDLRKRGATIQKANDCLIAHYALLADMTLLHTDSDFDLIANHTELKASRL
jgi:predicted nucleic acid-binding protein